MSVLALSLAVETPIADGLASARGQLMRRIVSVDRYLPFAASSKRTGGV
jgi:hypothetical protein